MTQAKPAAPRPNPVAIIGMMAAALALFTWALSNDFPIGLSGQASLLILTLLAFRSWPPMIQWVASMPIPHRVIFAVMIGSMVIGHYTLSGRTYFPYVSWFIFPAVDESDPVTCPEFIATTASGKTVRLLVEQQFPSVIQINRLDGYPPRTLDHLARALARVYNDHHADDPVKRVDLINVAVKLHPPDGESRTQPSCELLKRYDISSGQ